MLISPPFLPLKQANETDEQWIGRAMSGGAPGDGAYPVSFNLGWHGGIHLTAPTAVADGFEPVRAIADGTVVYKRGGAQASAPPTGDHPLNYRGRRTSDGVVVIRHETEIGAQGDTATHVAFFSIYMHLHTVRDTVRLNQRIYRKDEIGQAGYIYGDPNRIHFEIVCDDANLQVLINRTSGDLPTGDGRTDAVFGELYFRLPATALVYSQEQKPALNTPSPAGGLATGEELIVGLRYAEGEGTANERGHAYVTTYRPNGTILGDALSESDAEYNIYRDANAISNAYPATGRPAPSAAYELLRFGRVIGPDALTPGSVPHWRHIRTPTGTGWVNLNAADVHKTSDADFPQWRGWTLIDDSVDANSRCDSPTLRSWLEVPGPANAEANLRNPQVRARLSRTICKIPTEWDAATSEARWAWLKTRSDHNPEPLSDTDYERLMSHVQALAFWNAQILPACHWHFEPREFIRQFRKCGWLSFNELSQLLPRRSGASRASLAEITWVTAQNRFRAYYSDLNRTMRKYSIRNAARQTHFLAQTYIETAMWRTMEEIGRAHQQRRRNGVMYWPAPAMQFYQAFFGRGIMQLTWAGNYEAYGNYRAFPNVPVAHNYEDERITHTSLHYWADPRDRTGRIAQEPRQWSPRFDPCRAANDTYNACDSGAHYWVSKNIGRGLSNINRVCDEGITTNAIGRASVLVNGGGYGFAERQSYACFIARYRDDSTESGTDSTFNVNHGNRRHSVYVDFTPQNPR